MLLGNRNSGGEIPLPQALREARNAPWPFAHNHFPSRYLLYRTCYSHFIYLYMPLEVFYYLRSRQLFRDYLLNMLTFELTNVRGQKW